MAKSSRRQIFGYYEASVDKAGRFVMPADLYEAIGGRSPQRLLVAADGKCLELWPEGAFADLVMRLTRLAATLPPETASLIMTEYLGYSLEVQCDNAYRLTIPKKFRDFLGEDELVLIGIGEAVQIWSRSVYYAEKEERRRRLAAAAPKIAHAVLGLGSPMLREDGERQVEEGLPEA